MCRKAIENYTEDKKFFSLLLVSLVAGLVNGLQIVNFGFWGIAIHCKLGVLSHT